MTKNHIYTLIFILLGCVLALSGVLTAFEFSPALIGLGAGLIGASIARLIKFKAIQTDPEMLRHYQIEKNDPRNIEIQTLALAKAGNVLDILVIILSLIAIATSQPLWIILTLVSLFLIHFLVNIYYVHKLNKIM